VTRCGPARFGKVHIGVNVNKLNMLPGIGGLRWRPRWWTPKLGRRVLARALLERRRSPQKVRRGRPPL